MIVCISEVHKSKKLVNSLLLQTMDYNTIFANQRVNRPWKQGWKMSQLQ